LVTFLTFQQATGHTHAHYDVAIANYTALLTAKDKSKAEIRWALTALRRGAGLDRR
jgi:hypothetical protein